jgi:hypothetical protein
MLLHPGKPAALLLSLLLITPCLQAARAQGSGATPSASKFAEFDRHTRPPEMLKRLDAFAALLRKEPGATGWMLHYPGSILPGAAVRLSFTAENYLTRKGGVENSRLVRVEGWREGESALELWYVPPGAAYPNAARQAVYRDYTAAFQWDELYYLLREEKAALKGTEPETLDSNYYHEHSTFLDSFRSQIALPQSWRGRIVVRPKRGDPADLARRIAEYERRYLLRRHSVESSRVSVEVGEPDERRKVELWVVPGVIALGPTEFVPDSPASVEMRLGALVATLQTLKGVQAGSRVFAIAYTGAVADQNNARREVSAASVLGEIKEILLERHRLAPERVVLLDGGRQKDAVVELWIVPQGAVEPAPKLDEP